MAPARRGLGAPLRPALHGGARGPHTAGRLVPPEGGLQRVGGAPAAPPPRAGAGPVPDTARRAGLGRGAGRPTWATAGARRAPRPATAPHAPGAHPPQHRLLDPDQRGDHGSRKSGATPPGGRGGGAGAALGGADRPDRDPLRYTALRLADESTRGLGIWLGCARERDFRGLLPHRPPAPDRR